MAAGDPGVSGQAVQGHAEEEFDRKNAIVTVQGKLLCLLVNI